MAGVRGPDGNVWLHDGRRTFITKARHAGIDSTEIRKMSGHRSEAAFRRYNIINPADIMRASAKMDAATDDELSLLREERRPAKKIEAIQVDDVVKSAHRNTRE